jgi:hypothetical protein
VHGIDIADHLEHYDRSVSPKLYLTFSEKTWRRFFENQVQYINRFQRGEWLELFESNGFELVEDITTRKDIGSLKLAPQYAHMKSSDLECTYLKVALKKNGEKGKAENRNMEGRGQKAEVRGQMSSAGVSRKTSGI